MARNDGGPAFPRPGYEYQDEEGGRLQLACDALPGMSLRDWFAGQALAGLMVKATVSLAEGQRTAGWAYAFADAMIAERSKANGSMQ